MYLARLALASAVAAVCALSSSSGEACDTDPPAPQPAIRVGEVDKALNELLALEGLAPTRVGKAGLRPVDLDGDASTAEALVDVVAPEHCFGVTCITLVVRRDASGKLVTAGHGVWLVPLASRSNGWLDLGATAPLVTVRALRFQAGRYR